MNSKTIHHTTEDKSGLNRRDFLKASGLMASGLMFSQLAWARQPQALSFAQVSASQYYTPVFVMDQAARLSLGSSFMQAGLKHSLNSDIYTILPGNAFRLGSAMPFEKKELMPALEKLKTSWNAGQQDQNSAQRLAVLAGALCYQTAMPEIDKANQTDNSESKIYQDATLIGNYLSKGEVEGAQDSEAIHDLFRQMLTRTFIRFHTLMPDEADGGAWVMNLVNWRKNMDEYYRQLAEAIDSPNPSKVKQYISDTRFFDGNDTILKQVSPFERIANLSRNEADELVRSAADGSACAKALAAGYQTLITLSDYMADDISKDEMSSIMERM
ncbi:MAG: twin-arginine translocation signal domain-containing protein [Cyclobacteriaceae bacterium]